MKGSTPPLSFVPIQLFLSMMIICSLLSSCTKQSAAPGQYNDVRVVAESPHPILPGASADRRFGNDRPTRPANQRASGPQLAYELPPGWTDVPLTTMRRLNVLIAGDATTECYLTVLPGGGDLRANVDRWCQQMQQQPISDQELQALPKTMLLGAEATLFEINGTFTGGMSGKPVEDARLIAYVLPIGDTTVFLKATGPRAVLQSESDNLKQFATSIRLGNSAAPPPVKSTLRWVPPTGWQVDSPKPMREVTFIAGPQARCWITLLGGDGGGVLANTNRWLSELGQDPITATELTELPTVEFLGGRGIVIEGAGSYSSMGSEAQDGWALVGVIQNLQDQTIFIKLVGPEEEVKSAKASLPDLLSSLEVIR